MKEVISTPQRPSSSSIDPHSPLIIIGRLDNSDAMTQSMALPLTNPQDIAGSLCCLICLRVMLLLLFLIETLWVLGKMPL